MKLEVGMYVRTNKGWIGKLISKEKYMEGFCLKYKGQYNKTIWSSLGNDSEVIKASHNIIDLIEDGDYVNGYKVTFKDKDYKPYVQCDYPVQEGTTNHYRFYEEAIYSIVTKEQFESIKYQVN